MKDGILKNILTGKEEKICIKVCRDSSNSNIYSVFILSNNIDLNGWPANNNDKKNYKYSYVISNNYTSFEEAKLKLKKIILKPYPIWTFGGKYTAIFSKSKFEEIEL